MALTVPDVQPFIANDRSAIRYYIVFTTTVFSVGVALIAVSFLPDVIAISPLPDTAQKIGGGFVTVLSSFPLKECLNIRGRLRILLELQKIIVSLSALAEPPDDDVKRVTDLVWELYKKGAAG
ncbi:hypothetical protein HFN62_11930 [Rhizobium leguminosarum]|uniref:hypothetical protein n=1 Tax=Rhizobium leguminosarum TaxID=384 RepID=UPI001C937C30|nr:hypothetical protein [Rhizobium leguminosarum]MBY5612979.1 hypothetical protein [Rhizobium leguminosarum]MBY5659935.1 hypothetical protein [Rhizobium leguminosarum]MBY5784447.1 hypothetical protein [Rhizobium leguminosarum]